MLPASSRPVLAGQSSPGCNNQQPSPSLFVVEIGGGGEEVVNLGNVGLTSVIAISSNFQSFSALLTPH